VKGGDIWPRLLRGNGHRLGRKSREVNIGERGGGKCEPKRAPERSEHRVAKEDGASRGLDGRGPESWMQGGKEHTRRRIWFFCKWGPGRNDFAKKKGKKKRDAPGPEKEGKMVNPRKRETCARRWKGGKKEGISIAGEKKRNSAAAFSGKESRDYVFFSEKKDISACAPGNAGWEIKERTKNRGFVMRGGRKKSAAPSIRTHEKPTRLATRGFSGGTRLV